MTDQIDPPSLPAAKPRRDVVFMHIPKTGGTSVRIALEQTLRGHLILQDYGADPLTTPALYRLVYEERRLPEFRAHFSRQRGILLSGHFPAIHGTQGASRYWDFFNAESFATFLRDPIDRIYSEFAHLINLQGWTSGFEEFVTSERGRRRCRSMSLHLARVDVDSFGFIGFMEEFQESLAALGRYLGVDLPWKKKNVGNYETIDPEVVNGDRYRAMLEDLCRDDIALYERLRCERSGRYVAPGAASQVADSYAGRVVATGNRVTGWLSNTAREFITTVDILREGQVVASIPADRYRERAKTLGHSRTGVCAFEVDLRSLPGSGELTFRAHGTDYELSGSPIVL